LLPPFPTRIAATISLVATTGCDIVARRATIGRRAAGYSAHAAADHGANATAGHSAHAAARHTAHATAGHPTHATAMHAADEHEGGPGGGPRYRPQRDQIRAPSAAGRRQRAQESIRPRPRSA